MYKQGEGGCYGAQAKRGGNVMILLIDNYDSFTFNLFQFVGMLTSEVKVYRNDQITVEAVAALQPSHIILSPGPGFPKDAGICEEILEKLQGQLPILGVCLGHQAIGEVFGGKIVHAKELVHGKQSLIKIDNSSRLFKGLPQEIPAARYHSLIVEKKSKPECLEVLAATADGEIMAVKHRDHDIYGVQFHPESIMTPDGLQILRNFLAIH